MILYHSSQLLLHFLICVSSARSIEPDSFRVDAQPSIKIRKLKQSRKHGFNTDATSCLCDNDYRCLANNILSYKSKLQICVMTSDSGKVRIQDVKILQDGVVRLHPVKNGLSQSLDRNSGKIDTFRTEITSDNKNSVAVLKTPMISLFLENPYASQIAVHGVAKLSANDQDSNHKRRVDERDVNFAIRIDLQPSSTRNVVENDAWKVPSIIVCTITISIISVLLIAIAYIKTNKMNVEGTEKEKGKDEEDEFIHFDKRNERFDVKKYLRRSSEIIKVDENCIETDDHRGMEKRCRRHSEILSGGRSSRSADTDHKADFITELELV